ncbi:MAG TPA: alpha/beta hydrolase [Bacteroidales bacterium]|nr:alpha/beta hydrolase [Bacteroidales bacterium]
MKVKNLIIAMILLNAITITVSAQPVNIKLWPSGIPNSKVSKDYVEKTNTGTDGVVRVEKVSDPDMKVYLPQADKATGTAVLIIPGGGYGIIAIDHEGYAIAKWLNNQGIAGIVLKYRLPSDIIMTDKSVGPLQDAQEAIRIIRRNASTWKIDPHKIGVMGFSAGGHLASTLSTHYNEKVYEVKDSVSARPDFSLLIYPVITFDAAYTHGGSRSNLIGANPSDEQVKRFSNELQINKDTPPAFLVHSSDDTVVPVLNSINYFQGLQKNKIPAELHIFQKGGHGYGLGRTNGTEAGWPALCLTWMKAAGF